MRIAGASDTGWVPVDLGDVARAIASLRTSPGVRQERAERERDERLALPRR